MLGVNRIFPLQVLTAGAISLFFNITGAVAPVLNTPLILKLPLAAHFGPTMPVWP